MSPILPKHSQQAHLSPPPCQSAPWSAAHRTIGERCVRPCALANFPEIARKPVDANPLTKVPFGGLRSKQQDLLANFEQQTLIKEQAATIRALSNKLKYKHRKYVDAECALTALRDRYDMLRVELTALRQAMAQMGGDTIEDLKAEIRFYVKERLQLYQRIYRNHNFTMPPVRRIYITDSGEEIQQESVVIQLKRKAKEQYDKSNNAPEGRGGTSYESSSTSESRSQS